MKTKVEINGYEIVIEEKDGMILVSALKDEEVVEEFEIETSEGEDFDSEEGEDDLKGFDSFGQDEEEDFDSEEDEEDEEDFDSEEDEDDNEDEDLKLESFQSFINKRK